MLKIEKLSAGPFPCRQEDDEFTPDRQFHCQNYETCLNLAAALDWESFTCQGCSQEIDEKLCWKAHLAQKKDLVAEKICDIPELSTYNKK